MGPPEIIMGESKRKLESKQEAFEANPNRFIDREDIIVAAVRQKGPSGEHGVGYLCNGGMPNHVLITALYYIKNTVDEIIYAKRAAGNQAAKSGLIMPGDNGKSRIGGVR